MGMLDGNPRMARGIGAPRGRRVDLMPKCIARTTAALLKIDVLNNTSGCAILYDTHER